MPSDSLISDICDAMSYMYAKWCMAYEQNFFFSFLHFTM